MSLLAWSRKPSPLKRAPLLVCLAAAVALAVPAAANALPHVRVGPTLFLTTGGQGNGGATSSLPSNLWRVDPATGATTSLGNTGYAITGLAQDPTTGILYGVSNNNSPIAPKTLLTIDPANGAATGVGPIGLKIADISFDSTGKLFGWWDEPEDNLVSIDKATGAATKIGDAGIGTYGSGSAFDKDDSYWLFPEGEGEQADPNLEGSYYTIDVNTGKPTLKGRLTPIDSNRSSISAAAFDCARSTLYALVNNGGESAANLVTIDTATGTLTNKGETVTAADGLEWYCPLEFEFTTSAVKVAAKKQTLTIPLVRGPRIKGAASVSFGTVPGSAHAGRDFVATSGTLSFANNVSDGSTSLTVKGDPKAGKNRSFELALSSPTAGGTVGPPLKVTIAAAKPKRPTVKGPKSTSAGRVTFSLRSNQLPARFRCKLDKGKYKSCGKNGKKGKKYMTPPLQPGKHKLVVQVVNGAGKRSKPAKKVFTVLP
jgi:hypothetical protein